MTRLNGDSSAQAPIAELLKPHDPKDVVTRLKLKAVRLAREARDIVEELISTDKVKLNLKWKTGQTDLALEVHRGQEHIEIQEQAVELQGLKGWAIDKAYDFEKMRNLVAELTATAELLHEISQNEEAA